MYCRTSYQSLLWPLWCNNGAIMYLSHLPHKNTTSTEAWQASAMFNSIAGSEKLGPSRNVRMERNFPVIPIFRNFRPTSQGTPKVPGIVCSIHSPTQNFRNFWSNGKRPWLAIFPLSIRVQITVLTSCHALKEFAMERELTPSTKYVLYELKWPFLADTVTILFMYLEVKCKLLVQLMKSLTFEPGTAVSAASKHDHHAMECACSRMNCVQSMKIWLYAQDLTWLNRTFIIVITFWSYDKHSIRLLLF